MIDEVRRLVGELMCEVPGLVAVIVSDRDGVPILQTTTAAMTTTNPDGVNDDAFLRHQFLSSTTSSAADLGSKVSLTGVKKSLIVYRDRQVLTFVMDNVVLTFVAAVDTNSGSVEHFAQKVAPLVKDVSRAVIGEP